MHHPDMTWDVLKWRIHPIGNKISNYSVNCIYFIYWSRLVIHKVWYLILMERTHIHNLFFIQEVSSSREADQDILEWFQNYFGGWPKSNNSCLHWQKQCIQRNSTQLVFCDIKISTKELSPWTHLIMKTSFSQVKCSVVLWSRLYRRLGAKMENLDKMVSR